MIVRSIPGKLANVWIEELGTPAAFEGAVCIKAREVAGHRVVLAFEDHEGKRYIAELMLTACTDDEGEG